MSALADLPALFSALASPKCIRPVQKDPQNVMNSTTREWLSHWLRSPGAGAEPTNAACDTTTTGAMWPELTDSGDMWLAHLECLGAHQSDPFYGIFVFDRLVATSGLDCTIATTQTTNLPTAALTRYTDGVGVTAWIEDYSVSGTIVTTATVSYTNQDGTPGQTSDPFTVPQQISSGGLSRINLAPGDTGIRSVESYTQAAGQVGGGGNHLGITLLKPLLVLSPAGRTNGSASTGYRVMFNALQGAGNLPKIISGACLCVATTFGANASLSLQPRFIRG